MYLLLSLSILTQFSSGWEQEVHRCNQKKPANESALCNNSETETKAVIQMSAASVPSLPYSTLVSLTSVLSYCI